MENRIYASDETVILCFNGGSGGQTLCYTSTESFRVMLEHPSYGTSVRSLFTSITNKHYPRLHVELPELGISWSCVDVIKQIIVCYDTHDVQIM